MKVTIEKHKTNNVMFYVWTNENTPKQHIVGTLLKEGRTYTILNDKRRYTFRTRKAAAEFLADNAGSY